MFIYYLRGYWPPYDRFDTFKSLLYHFSEYACNECIWIIPGTVNPLD